MRQRCEYCNAWIDDADEVCPNCGAPNSHLMVSGEGEPKTIQELKEFCERHNLPLRQMRFYIGEDFKEPRAFGIYYDGTNYIVYKNKANGERAVRYRGKDEAYAVNELYQKMKSEVANQKNRLGNKKEQHARREVGKKRRGSFLAGFGICAAIAIALSTCVSMINAIPNRGYYDYGGTQYYYQNSNWYRYDDDASDWVPESTPPEDLPDNYGDYWEGSSYDSSYGGSDFSDSEWYQEPSSSNDDDDDSDSSWNSGWDDDDWDWDSSDSWDSGSTDWDSDW